MAKGIESSGPPDVTSYVDDLESRLTAVRAGYLDNLSGGAGALQASVDDLEAAVGAIEGATALHNKLTAARAALLDQITAVRLAELNAANLPADIDSLLARLTALRAGYLDELDFDLNARLGIPAGASLAADLLVIDNFVDDLEGAVGAIEGVTTLHNKLTAARAALLDGLTAVRLAELDAANLPADIDTLLVRLSALRAGYLDNLSAGAVALASVATEARLVELGAVNLPADIDTLLARLTAVRAGYLDELAAANIPADIDAILVDTGTAGVVVNSRTAAYGRGVGVKQVLEVSVTSAANAGDVTLATVTTQPCLIKSIVVHADTAAQIDLTSAAVAGGASKVVTFLSAADAAVANINAIDEQVAWTGAVRLAATKTIVISLVGTGATAVDLTVTIEYESCVAGGYLA